MDIEDIIDDLTEIQRITLLLLDSKGKEPLRGRLWFQKELYLLAQNLKELASEANFEPDLMGPYSENAEEELVQLELNDLIRIVDNRIMITPFGTELAKELRDEFKKEDIDMIEDFKEFMNDLSQDELLAFIYFSYPDTVSESVKVKPLIPKRDKIALQLYRKGKLSLEKSAKVAGLSVEKFMKLIKDKHLTLSS